MAKIGLLLPEQNMVDSALAILGEMKEPMDVVTCKLISSPEAVNEARNAAKQGAEILIARGHQARQIRRNTRIPLIEIRFTGQEIFLFMKRAHEITGKACPRVALVAFENMLPDLTHIEELCSVQLTVLLIDKYQDAYETLKDLPAAPDVVIGGPLVCEAAQNLGYLAFYYETTRESVAEAIRAAKILSYAIDTEKQNAAQMKTVFDVALSGIIRVNMEGTILALNAHIEEETGIRRSRSLGRPLSEVLPQISPDQLRKVLLGEQEFVTTSVEIRGEAWMVQIAAIAYEGQITGAILSLRKISDLTGNDMTTKSGIVQRGYSTTITFRDIVTENETMKEMLERARRYALSPSPVVLYAPSGTEAPEIAKAIHNNSDRSAGPFVSLNLGEIPPEEQMNVLFSGLSGERKDTGDGAFSKADHGTLYLHEAERLTQEVQRMIVRTMLGWQTLRTDALPMGRFDVRMILSAKTNLAVLVREGRFSDVLFYRLQGLTLTIPSLNERPEDLEREFSENIKYFSKKYHRSLQITDGGRKMIRELRWEGNRPQLRSFCERLVLTADRRKIDEVVLRQLHASLYPDLLKVGGQEKIVVYDAPEGIRIRELLAKFNGNREKVASELGISTTTLWRHMKKYGITPDYSSNFL